jgi:hypothetical protein
VGLSAEAALAALADGLLETVRTEPKGKLIVEWVRATPRGIAFVHDRDSPAAVLRELRELIGPTRDGVPVWMEEARREIAIAVARFERQGRELLGRLDDLTGRIDAALRRADAKAVVGAATGGVPWALTALSYLDVRRISGARGPCPLAELFGVVREECSDLTVPEFHDGLRRLADSGALRLVEVGDDSDPNPEYLLIVGTLTCSGVER